MTNKNEEEVVIKAPTLKHVEVPLEGISSLICHRFSEAAIKQIEDKQQGKGRLNKKKKRVPEDEYKDAFYKTHDGKNAFPGGGFKRALVDAASPSLSPDSAIKMKMVRGAVQITDDMVEIVGDPHMRTDTVRLGGKTSDVRYRPEFRKWSCVVNVLFNADLISVKEIFNLFELAGFLVGVGDWRPQCNGSHGMFRVKRDEEEKKDE